MIMVPGYAEVARAGQRSCQGMACSKCRAISMTTASAPNGATNWMPIGRPSGLGCPGTLKPA
jgi:hypothetical protein